MIWGSQTIACPSPWEAMGAPTKEPALAADYSGSSAQEQDRAASSAASLAINNRSAAKAAGAQEETVLGT